QSQHLRVLIYSHSNALSAFCINHTAAAEVYTLSLHDALPILDHPREALRHAGGHGALLPRAGVRVHRSRRRDAVPLADLQERLRSEEHTSELQSQSNLVCRLLLEKN